MTDTTITTTQDIKFTSDLTVQLIDAMGSDASILRAMMVSTLAEASAALDMTEEAALGRLNFLMKNRHGTPFEHGAMTFRVHVPIMVYREWHRHRIGQSYNEESGRYRQLDPVFYIPPPERPLVQVGKPGAYEYVPGTPEQYERLVARHKRASTAAYDDYLDSLADDVAKEVARSILPVNIYSSMYVTMNPRSCMAFLQLRTNEPESMFPSKPMWEIDQCARQVEQALTDLYPNTHHVWNDNGRVAP